MRLRQVDLASKAEVSQSMISLVERGHLDRLSLRSLRAIFRAVDASFDGVVSWRGGAIDRLLDERHATLVGAVAAKLERLGWQVEIEVSFNEYGDRGSVDILALMHARRIALIVEIKTELTGIDVTVRRIDVKERVASKVVRDRFGWSPQVVGRLVVLLDNSTNRRRVLRHDGVLRVAFPDREGSVRSWLRRPDSRLSGLLFTSPSNRGDTRTRTAAAKARIEPPVQPPTRPVAT